MTRMLKGTLFMRVNTKSSSGFKATYVVEVVIKERSGIVSPTGKVQGFAS